MSEWRPSPVSYLEPSRVICALCGQLVPGQYWAEEIDGAEHIFCNPAHARKYETYWLPLYGEKASR